MECPICLEEYNDENNSIITLHDSHTICINCYNEIVKKKMKNCCYCREHIDFELVDIENNLITNTQFSTILHNVNQHNIITCIKVIICILQMLIVSIIISIPIIAIIILT